MDWRLHHSAGPPSASCFYIFSPAERARQARADRCGPTAQNYIRAKASSVKRWKMLPAGLKMLAPESVTNEGQNRFMGSRDRLSSRIPISALGSLPKNGAEDDNISGFWVGGRNRPRICKDLTGKKVWNADCSIQSVRALRRTRSKAVNVQRWLETSISEAQPAGQLRRGHFRRPVTGL
jgi:hypothetical protein